MDFTKSCHRGKMEKIMTETKSERERVNHAFRFNFWILIFHTIFNTDFLFSSYREIE